MKCVCFSVNLVNSFGGTNMSFLLLPPFSALQLYFSSKFHYSTLFTDRFKHFSRTILKSDLFTCNHFYKTKNEKQATVTYEKNYMF